MRNRYVLLIILLIVFFNIPIVLADGEEWLTGWTYRKSITIIGSIDGVQTDYQIGFIVYQDTGVDGNITIGHTTFGKIYTSAQDDFGDIRPTKADGITELDYWIEYISSADYSIIWVEVDTIPESPNEVNIYIYYGTEGATSTTSNMSTTWTDSLDWTSDLTGDFTLYESTASPDREDTWLTPTDAEYPARLIVKRAITDVWSFNLYGFLTKITLQEDADDTRDSVDDLLSVISDDTDHGADGTHAGYQVHAKGVTDNDVSTITLDQWLINDLITVNDTSASNDWYLEGRPSLKLTNTIAEGQTELNYWGYSLGAGGAINTETFSYDGVNDVIEWGGQRGTVGEHYEKSSWMVLGKYTANEPTWGDWGLEEEIEVPIDTVNLSASIILLLFLILVASGLIYGVKK